MPSLGETFRVTATITDISGNPLVAPTSQLVELYDPSNNLNQSNKAPTVVGGGVFYVDFTTLATDPVGLYIVVWTAVDGTVTGIEKEKVFIDDPPI